MNFILFNVILLAAGFGAVLIFSVGLMACLAPLALFAKSDNSPKIVMFPLLGIAGIYQIYFWGCWAAFCVAMTIMFTQKPEVTWDWLYWLVGFFGSTSLMGWLAHKERQGSQSFVEARGIQKGTMLYSLVVIVAFFVFAFNPSLMPPLYGWALTPLGLAQDGSINSVAKAGASEQKIAVYTDNVYDYAFQFPSDWKMKKSPEVGEAGDMRVLLEGPACTISTTVSKVGKTITKKQFQEHPNRNQITESMMNLTVEQVYKKSSNDIHATRMVLGEKQILPSDHGIKFYISTLHTVGEKNIPLGVAGIHIYPFNKDYLVNFVMISPLRKDAKEENQTCTNVFNSFHLVGEELPT